MKVRSLLLFVVLVFAVSANAQHFTPVWTSPFQPMNIYVTGALFGGIELTNGDEIAVYDGSYCVGSIVLTGPITSYVNIIASLNDPTTAEVDGFTEGNSISYRFWISTSSTEVPNSSINPAYATGDGFFHALGSAQVDLSGLIPVELTSFNASVNGSTVTLAWVTATETNNQRFEVYRNGTLAGTVEGHGTTTEANSYTFTDAALSSGNYRYMLRQLDYDGTFAEFDGVEVNVGTTPVEFTLAQNFPNPFNPSTMISYSVAEAGTVSLTVYNETGETVAVLVNEVQEPGTYFRTFDASHFSSGIYFYTLQAGTFSVTNKMMLIK